MYRAAVGAPSNGTDFGDIRPARPEDAGRIAEILVFGKRCAYRDIFRDDRASFLDLNVISEHGRLVRSPEALLRAFVYDDGIVKGVLTYGSVADQAAELCELYVDPFFIGKGIGSKLLRRFLSEARVGGAKTAFLWRIERNEKAARFYERFGFVPDGARRMVEGTQVSEVRCCAILAQAGEGSGEGEVRG